MYRTGRKKKIIAVVTAVIMMITVSPYLGGQAVWAKSANSITAGAANTGKVTVPEKASYDLQAKAKTGKLTYKSSKKSVASVTKKGVIQAKKAGKTVITIKGKGVTKKVSVTVVKKNKYKIVKALKFKGVKKKMTAGDKQKLKVAFTPSKASNKNLKFKSSKTSVATVTENGVVKAKKAGKAKITVTSCANKKAKKTVAITVKAKKSYTVTFNTHGGTAVPAQTVKAGSKAKKPADPVLSGAEFAGWYLDGESKAFDFGSKITGDITLFARWNVKDVSSDGEVDAADLALLEAAGKIDVMDGADGTSPHAIVGRFTNEKVADEADAAEVLKSIESSFNTAVDEDGNLVETDFDVKAGDITTQEIDTPADEDGIDAPKQILYRYQPQTPAGIPVEGADIVLSTDAKGNVTGLNSTYDAAFQTAELRTGNNMSERYAKALATRYMNTVVLDDGSLLVPQDNMIQLYTQSELVLYTAVDTADQFAGKMEENGGSNDNGNGGSNGNGDTNDNGEAAQKTMPFYAYKVNVTSFENVPDPGDFDPEAGLPSTGELPEGGEPEDSGESSYPGSSSQNAGAAGYIPLIDWTVYVDANTGEIRLAYDNTRAYKWYSDTFDLKTLKGSYQKVDIRWAYYDKKYHYEYYDKNRKITVFQAREYLGKDENGNYVYAPEDRTKTEALITTAPQSAPTANTILYHAEKVYDYYNNVLGRQSFDGKKKNIYIGYYADYLNGTLNAFWNKKHQKIFITFPKDGKDEARCLDVLGHEFTHATIDYVIGGSGFTRSGESGALDEAYCDIIGNSVEGKFSKGNWDHSEDRAQNGTSDPSRSLYNPTNYTSYRDHYRDKYTGTKDDGGAHWNSTIFSHAFYKMAVDSRTRTQISCGRWAQLFYRSLSRLSSDSDFLDARYAVLAEADAMGFTSQQKTVMKDAFDAVGIKTQERATFTLTWGSTPDDVDIRLIGPIDDTSGQTSQKRFEVYYANKIQFNNDNSILAALEKDVRGPNGKEVITMYHYPDGTYYCLVIYPGEGDDKQSSALANSGACLTAYSPYAGRTNYYYDTDARGKCWLACRIIVRNGFPLFYDFSNYYSDKALCRYGGNELLDRVRAQY